jgi:putative endonuclease
MTHSEERLTRLECAEFRDDAFVRKMTRSRELTMRKPKRFHVYIMTNRPRSHVLYTGITGNLSLRVFQHKNKLVPGFTSRYNLTRLVYYEYFAYPGTAIAREKEIKGWRRSKKINLIESMNPRWHDLAESWTDVYKPAAPHSARARCDRRKIPRSAGKSAELRDDAFGGNEDNAAM